MNWTQDIVSGAIYVGLADGESARQAELPGGLVVDLDDSGRPLGVEVLGAPTIKQVQALREFGVPHSAQRVIHELVVVCLTRHNEILSPRAQNPGGGEVRNPLDEVTRLTSEPLEFVA